MEAAGALTGGRGALTTHLHFAARPRPAPSVTSPGSSGASTPPAPAASPRRGPRHDTGFWGSHCDLGFRGPRLDPGFRKPRALTRAPRFFPDPGPPALLNTFL